MKSSLSQTVLLTDYAWADVEIERGIIESAGFKLISGDSSPASAEIIAQMVRDHHPAAILTCWAQVSADAIAASPDLRIISGWGSVSIISLSTRRLDEASGSRTCPLIAWRKYPITRSR